MQSKNKQKPSLLKGHRHICRICTPSSLIPSEKVLFDLCPSCWIALPEEAQMQQEMYLLAYEAIQEAGGLIPQSHLAVATLNKDVSFFDSDFRLCVNLMFAKGFIKSTTIQGYRHFSFTKAGVLHLKTLEPKPVVVENQLAMSF